MIVLRLLMSTALMIALPAALGAAPHHAKISAVKVADRERGELLSRVSKANRNALQEPSTFGFVNAAQVYAWSQGSLYRMYTAPEMVSDIALQPGEALISVAAGDTARWVIGDTKSGSGSEQRTHILVKPSAPGLRTNLVIATDKRTYLLMLQSTSGPAMAALSWTYPEDALLALAKVRETQPVAGGIALERLNFDYAIEGDRPSWMPLRAFDDGEQVFIEFPPSVASGDIPPLFVVGASGKAELVNYRQRGRYYVVDQLFQAAELRLGEKHQQVVRIIRTNGAARERRRG